MFHKVLISPNFTPNSLLNGKWHCRTKVLEARDRVGGRVHTVQHDGAVLELGAQWLHGGCHSNNLFNFCLRHNLLGGEVRTLGQKAGHFYTSSGRVIKKASIERLEIKESPLFDLNFMFFIWKEVADKAWELYDQLNEFDGLEGRDTTVSLRDFYWEFVDNRIEEDEDDLRLCMGGLSLSLSGQYYGTKIPSLYWPPPPQVTPVTTSQQAAQCCTPMVGSCQEVTWSCREVSARSSTPSSTSYLAMSSRQTAWSAILTGPLQILSSPLTLVGTNQPTNFSELFNVFREIQLWPCHHNHTSRGPQKVSRGSHHTKLGGWEGLANSERNVDSLPPFHSDYIW